MTEPPKGAYESSNSDSWQFLTKSGEAERFTEHLTSIVCQQRHLATRIVVATQTREIDGFKRCMPLCNGSEMVEARTGLLLCGQDLEVSTCMHDLDVGFQFPVGFRR